MKQEYKELVLKKKYPYNVVVYIQQGMIKRVVVHSTE